MAYNVKDCSASKGNTGLSECLDDLGRDFIVIHTPTTFEVDTESNAKLEATWLTAINAKNASPFPAFEAIEDTSEDDVVQELPSGSKLQVREGKYGGKGTFRVALCNLAALRTYNNLKGRIVIITDDGSFLGTSPDGIVFKGFLLSEFKVGKLQQTDGTTKRMVPLDYQLAAPTEFADFPASFKPTWNALGVVGIKDVTVAVDSSAEGLVVVSVTGVCDGEGVEGLVEADFLMFNDALSTVLPADTFTDNDDGTYDFVFTTPVLPATGYSVNLTTPALQTTGGYESSGADTFTIV